MNTICGMYARTAGEVGGLDAMLAALPGRETDAVAVWQDGTVRLGWRGDASANAGVDKDRAECLPRGEGAAGLAVTASARLDDREALCAALAVPHPERRGLSDGALILRAYRRWGFECPHHLLGDYAFAVWDAEHRTLFCARDHIGARPLYYCATANRIVFASDVNAVLAAPGVSDALDESATATWLARPDWQFGARTFFRAIRRLPPGHLLAVGSGPARVARWWRPENAPSVSPGDDDSVADAFLALYAQAVEDRVRVPHPVGVHLSGGLDSSSVAVLAARALQRMGQPAPRFFSWHPPPGDDAHNTAEHALIEAVSRQENLPVFYCPPSTSDVVAFLRRDVTRHANSHENEWPVQRCAAGQGVRVLLSGWGGDEGVSFNGRGYFPELLRSGRFGTLWRQVRETDRHPLAAIMLGAVLPLITPAAPAALARLRQGRWPAAPRRTYVHPAFARRARLLPPAPSPPAAGVRPMQLHLLRARHLGTRIDGWAASGARHGIEYRYPLLDRRLLEFALGLPPEQFRRGSWNRWLMRRSLGSILPAAVQWSRTKQDPVRFAAYRDRFAEALVEARAILDARSTPPSRSPYLDMPGLVRHLDADRFRADPRPGAIARALQFLDF